MSQSKPIRILYIEDDRDLAALVRFRLGEAGYVVDIAHDGAEGLAKCTTGSYDLVAVDHSIPVRNGLEVIGILASRGPLPPTIMITGSGNERIAVETMKRGADDYIVKDVAGGWLDLLPGVIERVLAQRRLAREKERVEEKLRESENRRVEAEKLAAAGRMAARVAHEINNPLAGIKAAFQVVKKAIPEDYPRYKHVGRIEKEIERIERIVRQMIHLHRAEREAESSISIEETVNDVVAMLRPICRKHEVSIEVDTESCRDLVKLSENGLRQVLYALLVNGIEASPKGGVVRVQAVADQRAVQITVADQGPGVPQQLGDRIFEPFFTTKGTEVTGGLGLGLPIARGIVEAWGGTLDFESQPDQGSVFRIVLPRGDADESSNNGPSGQNSDCG